MTVEVLRYAVFTRNGRGGRPAGVVLGADHLPHAQMSAVAQAIGYPTTAFLLPPQRDGDHLGIRYFSPRAEILFCGTATIATAIAHASRHGPGRLPLLTAVGPIVVDSEERDGGLTAVLTFPPGPARSPAALGSSGLQDGRARPHVAWRETFRTTDGRAGGRVDEDAEDAEDLVCWAAAFGRYLGALGALVPGEEVTLRRGGPAAFPHDIRVSLTADGDRVRVRGAATPLPLSPYDDQEPP